MSQHPASAQPDGETLYQFREEHEQGLAALAEAFADFSEAEQLHKQFQQHVRNLLVQTDRRNYLRRVALSWQRQTSGQEQAVKQESAPALSTQLLGCSAKDKSAFPMPLEVVGVALAKSDTLPYQIWRSLEEYVRRCLNDITDYCQLHRILKNETDYDLALLFLAESAHFLQVARPQRNFKTSPEIATWQETLANLITLANQHYGAGGYLLCAELLYLLGNTISGREPELLLLLKMRVVEFLLDEVNADNDCLELLVHPAHGQLYVPWLHCYAECWQALPLATRQASLTDPEVRSQVNLVDLFARITGDKQTRQFVMAYRHDPLPSD